MTTRTITKVSFTLPEEARYADAFRAEVKDRTNQWEESMNTDSITFSSEITFYQNAAFMFGEQNEQD